MAMAENPTENLTESEAAPDAAIPEEPGSSADAATGAEDAGVPTPEEETAILKARIAELERMIAEKDALVARVTAECEEFEGCFPDVPIGTVPDEVWEKVHAGVPLAAAYALYEKKRESRKLAAEACNSRNAAQSAGIPAPGGAKYFSPAEVRAMSRKEVRENYDRIFDSMRHWQ